MEKCSCHAFVITDIMNITIVPELSPDQLKTHNAHQTWISFGILICHSRSSAMPKNTYIAKMNILDACKNHPQKSICSQVRKYFPYVDFWKRLAAYWICMRGSFRIKLRASLMARDCNVRTAGDCKMCCKGQKWGLSEARLMCPCQWIRAEVTGLSSVVVEKNPDHHQNLRCTKNKTIHFGIQYHTHKQVIIRLVQWGSDATWDENVVTLILPSKSVPGYNILLILELNCVLLNKSLPLNPAQLITYP